MKSINSWLWFTRYLNKLSLKKTLLQPLKFSQPKTKSIKPSDNAASDAKRSSRHFNSNTHNETRTTISAWQWHVSDIKILLRWKHSQLIKVSGKFTFNVVLMSLYLFVAFCVSRAALIASEAKSESHASQISIKSKLGSGICIAKNRSLKENFLLLLLFNLFQFRNRRFASN